MIQSSYAEYITEQDTPLKQRTIRQVQISSSTCRVSKICTINAIQIYYAVFQLVALTGLSGLLFVIRVQIGPRVSLQLSVHNVFRFWYFSIFLNWCWILIVCMLGYFPKDWEQKRISVIVDCVCRKNPCSMHVKRDREQDIAWTFYFGIDVCEVRIARVADSHVALVDLICVTN